MKNTVTSNGHPESTDSDNRVVFSTRKGSIQAPMVVSELTDGCLYSGFFGRLDSARMKHVMDRILESVEQTSCEVVIIDLASIDVIDSVVASQLLKVGDILKLIGVSAIFCGIPSIVAQTMVGTGVSFERFFVARNLKGALLLALDIDGVSLRDKK